MRLGLKTIYQWGSWSIGPQLLPQNLKLPVTLLNTNSYNVWIRQTLLAADIVEVEHCPWDFHSTMSLDGDQVQVSFCPVPTLEVQEEVLCFGVT